MNFGTKGCMYNCGDECTGECIKVGANKLSLDKITVQWEKEYKKCKDPVYFYSHYLMIKNTDGTMSVPPPLSDKAKEDMRKCIGFKPKQK